MDSTNNDLSDSLNKPNNNRLTLCQVRICFECGTNHSFRGNVEDAITSIDVLPELFPRFFKNCSSGGNRLQDLVN
jgi:hypothetical protein